jgi:hypothetical protein
MFSTGRLVLTGGGLVSGVGGNGDGVATVSSPLDATLMAATSRTTSSPTAASGSQRTVRDRLGPDGRGAWDADAGGLGGCAGGGVAEDGPPCAGTVIRGEASSGAAVRAGGA